MMKEHTASKQFPAYFNKSILPINTDRVCKKNGTKIGPPISLFRYELAHGG
jgi:hypothetical protein